MCFRYYGGPTLDCLAQTEPLIIKEPADKLKKFIKRQKSKCNGIENNGFQDEPLLLPLKISSSLEDLRSHPPKEEIQSGVKKKLSTGLRRSESTSMRGAKKKVRQNVSPKSPNKEYYQIWAATSTSSVTDKRDSDSSGTNALLDDESAPPLPPRAIHKPLERSKAVNGIFSPPAVLRSRKPKKNQKPEDTFSFELIDIDELSKKQIQCCDPTTSSSMSGAVELNNINNSSHKIKTALLENSRTLIGSDNYITTVLMKNLDLDNTIIASPCKKQSNITTHTSLETKESQSSVSTLSSSSLEVTDDTKPEIVVKPHKPLTRQISNSNIVPQTCECQPIKLEMQEQISGTSEDSTSDNAGAIVHLVATPDRKCTDKIDKPNPLVKPQLKALARVASSTNHVLVCPPTPTHHARRLKNSESLRPPGLKNTDLPVDGHEVVPSPEIRLADVCSLDTLNGWATCNGVASALNAETDSSNLTENRNGHPVLRKPEMVLQYKENPRLSLRALTELHNFDSRSPEIRSKDISRPSIDLRVRECDNNSNRGGEASGGIPLPLRHLTSTRLPSIPERTPRVLAVAEIPGEQEDPLPPCKFI